jgi:hypothetical protein
MRQRDAVREECWRPAAITRAKSFHWIRARQTEHVAAEHLFE